MRGEGQQRFGRHVRALGALGPVAVLLFIAADVVGSRVTPGYSPVSDAISELVETGAAAKAVVDPLLLAYHALVIPFAAGLHVAIAERGRVAGPLLIGIAGLLGVILTLAFPCDPGCAPFVSLRGTLHILIAIPMGFAILIGLFLTARRFRADPRWHGFARYSQLSAGIGVVLAVVTVVMAETGWVGVLERALTATYLQWYAVVGLAIASGRGVTGPAARPPDRRSR
jgi:hypothetical membrane protein